VPAFAQRLSRERTVGDAAFLPGEPRFTNEFLQAGLLWE
jgi:hypothetical protein